GEHRSHAFSEVEFLRDRRVQVPTRQTAEVTRGPTSCIETEYTTPERIKDARRILPHVYALGIVGADAHGSKDAAITGGVLQEWSNRNRALKGARRAGNISDLPEGLARR